MDILSNTKSETTSRGFDLMALRDKFLKSTRLGYGENAEGTWKISDSDGSHICFYQGKLRDVVNVAVFNQRFYNSDEDEFGSITRIRVANVNEETTGYLRNLMGQIHVDEIKLGHKKEELLDYGIRWVPLEFVSTSKKEG